MEERLWQLEGGGAFWCMLFHAFWMCCRGVMVREDMAAEKRRIFWRILELWEGGGSGELRERLLWRIFWEKLEAGGGFSSWSENQETGWREKAKKSWNRGKKGYRGKSEDEMEVTVGSTFAWELWTTWGKYELKVREGELCVWKVKKDLLFHKFLWFLTEIFGCLKLNRTLLKKDTLRYECNWLIVWFGFWLLLYVSYWCLSGCWSDWGG